MYPLLLAKKHGKVKSGSLEVLYTVEQRRGLIVSTISSLHMCMDDKGEQCICM